MIDMENIVYTKTYIPPPVDKKTVLGYGGIKESTKEIDKLLDLTLKEVTDRLAYNLCWSVYPITVADECVCLPFGPFRSIALSKHLSGCDYAIVFGATIGLYIDRLITKYSSISPTKALLLQAIGAERIEALCDTFADDLGRKYSLTKRFSPGYGDLSLNVQSDLFSALGLEKKIGLTLTESLLMSPTKSVTAIMGIRREL